MPSQLQIEVYQTREELSKYKEELSARTFL